jgi:hypothetical protein
MNSQPAQESCIVCEGAAVRKAGPDSARYECYRCEQFVVSDSVEQTLPAMLDELPIRRSLMSHALRRIKHPDSRRPLITTTQLPSFWAEERLPTVRQMADALILWIGNTQRTPFEHAGINRAALAATIGLPITAHADSAGFSWLNAQLEAKKLYDFVSQPNNLVALKLTMAGWELHENLKKTNIESRLAFMAMKFGKADVAQAVNKCFRPAVARAGFDLRMLTDQQPAGLIDDQMRAAILASRFVISDLTHGSPGAYWEAGYGQGLGLPVIYTCEKSAWMNQHTHFDTNHLKTIIWDLSDDLEQAGNELTATIRATLRAEAKQTDE